MLPAATLAGNTEESEKKNRERKARDEQAEAYDRMVSLKLFSLVEIPATLRRLRLSPQQNVVEVGCGTGRLTSVLAPKSASVIALDFSWESLVRCQAALRLKKLNNVDLIQADATAIPLKSEIAEKTLSCQVLEHIPTPGSRSRMVSELARIAQKDSDIVLSAYKHSLITKIFDQKEGEHPGGIYYHRFSRAELLDLLGESMEVRSMTGAMVYHYLVHAAPIQV